MTPREFHQQLEGYRWRDERAWEKYAVLISYLLQPWSKDIVQPQKILDAIQGKTSETEFEKVAGFHDPAEAFDAMVAKQAERRKGAAP